MTVFSRCLCTLTLLLSVSLFGTPSLAQKACAQRANFPNALVTGAAHAETLGIVWGELPSANHFSALIASAPAVPHFLLPAFIW